VLGYHAKYFRAISHWHLGENAQKEAEKNAKGMGAAVSYLKVAVAKFEEARPFVNPIGGSYKTNFETKLADAVALRDKAFNDNRSIYYESEIDLS